jgi:hypothetical protein
MPPSTASTTLLAVQVRAKRIDAAQMRQGQMIDNICLTWKIHLTEKI